ncbi:SIS domain-containing protein, partial [Thiohalocapsa sp.]|uniref:KpsF/GutQ family sugar-phosphate isomerase n=1 Tax=Thiohalocapsa sp. TaxID=2497641 RepID=UPI0025D5B1DC
MTVAAKSPAPDAEPTADALGFASASHIALGRRVFELEAAALRTCAAHLDHAFAEACKRILATQGRVVTTGMGKSGHVARKIAATLASTGTPAFYVHPSEASHGDLGMLARGDLVLALSNSGETPELGDVLTYTRRFSLPLLGLVGRAPSTLADQADVALVLPRLEEACPMGLAPTTSTPARVPLGDALAAAVLAAKGVDHQAVAPFPPGGTPGPREVAVARRLHRRRPTP